MSKKHDFTDLVLLVGTNPLPNYVVGKYFSLHNQNLNRIWLIYSEKTEFNKGGTKQYADDIEAVLKKEIARDINIKKEPISEISRSSDISNETREILSPGKCEEIEKLHLNYTGGTKAMSVHVYRELEKLWGQRFSASYLDARDFSIKFDDYMEYDIEDLRKTIEISWEGLFQLHNTKMTKKGERYLDYLRPEEIENVLSKLFILVEKGKVAELKEWVKESNKLKPNITDKSTHDIINETMARFNINNNRVIFEFLKSLPEDDQNFYVSGKRKEKFSEFLNGKWLEIYVCQLIKKMKPESAPLLNYNLIPITDSQNSKNKKDFEMDVIMKNGYQICGISCGTAIGKGKEGELKNKGFEVILRSRQLGGDEARAILVTLLNKNDIDRFERDLKGSAGSGRDNFTVLGIDDLPPEKMWSKIEKHVFKEGV